MTLEYYDWNISIWLWMEDSLEHLNNGCQQSKSKCIYESQSMMSSNAFIFIFICDPKQKRACKLLVKNKSNGW